MKSAPLYELNLQGEVTHHQDLVAVNRHLSAIVDAHQARMDDLVEVINSVEPLADDEADKLFEELDKLQNEDPLASTIVRKWNADQGRWEEVVDDLS